MARCGSHAGMIETIHEAVIFLDLACEMLLLLWLILNAI